MSRTTPKIATALIATGLLACAPAIAQQPADQTPPPAAENPTHNDPIVQKRMEVREANRKQREANAKINKHAREQRAKTQAARNQSVQQSRSRASAAMSASEPQ